MVTMVSKVLAVIIKFSWMESGEKSFYEENRLCTLTKLISSIFLTVRDNSKDDAFEGIVETRVTGSFHSGAFKDCSSKSG